MKKKRPINLDFLTIRFPVTSISSILHRVSGVVIFVMLGVLLWILDTSLSSPENFKKISVIANSFFVKFIIWGGVTIFGYHILSGVRHIFIDFIHFPETLKSGRFSSSMVLVFSIVFSFVAGVFILW